MRSGSRTNKGAGFGTTQKDASTMTPEADRFRVCGFQYAIAHVQRRPGTVRAKIHPLRYKHWAFAISNGIGGAIYIVREKKEARLPKFAITTHQ